MSANSLPAHPALSLSDSHPDRPAVTEGGRQILDLLLKTGGLSQAEITHRLTLSQPTVARLLQGFQKAGLVRTSQRQADRPGNPSVNVSLEADHSFSLGIALLGDVLSVGLMDLSGRLRATRTTAMTDMSRFSVLSTLQRFHNDLLEETSVPPTRIIGAGLGISAFYVEPERFNPPRYLDDWAFHDIAPIIETALGYPTLVDNDGTVAAIGESLFGAGRTSQNFAYLHLSNGFGGGLICSGQPYRGQNGNAGEFGGVWILEDEGYPNLDLLKAILTDRGQTFETVEDMVLAIDRTVDGVDLWLDEAEKPFSRLASLIAYILDPQKIVIGGRLPKDIAQALADRIRIPSPTLRRERPAPLPEVIISQTEGDPVVLGAAAMPLQKAYFICP
ncbi:MAG: ROK family transcriptional regulator [Asticcacaulis sp.]